MTHKLTPTAAALLMIPPVLWAGNAVVGRMISPQISPMLLNLLRWTSPRTIKENFAPPTDYRYPHMGKVARAARAEPAAKDSAAQ